MMVFKHTPLIFSHVKENDMHTSRGALPRNILSTRPKSISHRKHLIDFFNISFVAEHRGGGGVNEKSSCTNNLDKSRSFNFSIYIVTELDN